MTAYIFKRKWLSFLLNVLCLVVGIFITLFLKNTYNLSLTVTVILIFLLSIFTVEYLFSLIPLYEGRVESYNVVVSDMTAFDCGDQLSERGFEKVIIGDIVFFVMNIDSSALSEVDINYVGKYHFPLIDVHFKKLIKPAKLLYASDTGTIPLNQKEEVLCVISDDFESGSIQIGNCCIVDDLMTNRSVGKEILSDGRSINSTLNLMPVEKNGERFDVLSLVDSGLANGLRIYFVVVNRDGLIVPENRVVSETLCRFSERKFLLQSLVDNVIGENIGLSDDEFCVKILGYARDSHVGFAPVIACRVDLLCDMFLSMEEDLETLDDFVEGTGGSCARSLCRKLMDSND